MNKKGILLVFLSILFLCPASISSQESAGQWESANTFFENHNYKQAAELYEAVYEEKHTDPVYLYRYGVSLYEIRQNLDKAAEMLQEAAKKKQTEAYLYLGDVYTEQYMFSEAEQEYNQYAKLKRKDSHAQSLVERKKEEINRLKVLTSHTENIQIIDSVIIDKSNFLSAYKLSPSGGKVLYFNQVFNSNMDVNSTVYINEKGTKIYFAQPEGGLYTLYSMDKLLDGFGNEKKLDENNFGFSENINYVFVMPDGLTTYFAAEDPSGIGGYDLYVTRYNLNTGTYLTPERLNMPFNSIYNDYMMVVDEEKGVGWFATDRYMPDGKICIYTFIPNSVVDMIQSDDENYLAARSRISSIKDTWIKDRNYNPIIALANKEIKETPKEQADFEFVINDEHTYCKYEDFRSETAKNTYKKVAQMKKDLADTENELLRMRENFITASQSDKNRISNRIIGLEQQVSGLKDDIYKLEITARNTEVKHLTAK